MLGFSAFNPSLGAALAWILIRCIYFNSAQCAFISLSILSLSHRLFHSVYLVSESLEMFLLYSGYPDSTERTILCIILFFLNAFPFLLCHLTN